jgi:predicted TIM-barrel fold metal-dependent hydrolase
MTAPPRICRRRFLGRSALALLAGRLPALCATEPAEPIIDIHQHTNYTGRSDEQLVAHQRALGVTRTVLLPAGRLYGLAAQCGGNETVVALARRHPGEYVHFANELPYLPEAREEIEKYLKLGALGIGEQKFHVECDSKHIERVADLAQEYGVPVLLHFQHETYNLRFDRFHRILEKFPKVNFIGHAQTWWANIDKDHGDQTVLYPKTQVTPGGLTDRYLREYPNMFGDLSAGSGLNALIRDEDHARGFLERHQDKLLFGSDCNDVIGRGPGCTGAQIIAAVRRLAPSKAAERKLLYENAKKILKL